MRGAGTPDLELRRPSGSTAAFLGRDALARAGRDLDAWVAGRSIFLITSREVEALAAEPLAESLGSADEVHVLRVEDGEGAKTLASAERLWREMVVLGGRRDSRIIGLGGGSTGDLSGFVAGAFMRGVQYCLVPTTLLAQVDASIGGKTAVDLPEAKNAVGLFWFPELVVSDVCFLETLPGPELSAGLVEVVKIAAADDLELFEWLEDHLDQLVGADLAVLAECVVRAVRAKVRVVEDDLREGDRRRLLNLGHTLGHAIEVALNYEGLRHGEAVAHGMRFACQLARSRGRDSGWLDRCERLLDRLRIPVLPPLDAASLIDAISRDKKAVREGAVWVLPRSPGEIEFVSDLGAQALSSELSAFLQRAATGR